MEICMILFRLMFDLHRSLIVWDHHNSVSVLLCLNDVIFFKQYLATAKLKNMPNMFIYTHVFHMYLKYGVVKYCLKKNSTV